MIRHLFLALILTAVTAVWVNDKAHAGIQDFTVYNQGNTAVWYIYISPNYSDSWEEDVLGSDVLMPGNGVPIAMNGYGDHCYFDIRIEDSNGRSEDYYDVDLCNVSTVYFPSSAPTSEKNRDTQRITVVNNGAMAVWYIHVSPNYSDSWEEDVLGDDVLMPGMQIPVTLTGYDGHCYFDVKVEDANGYAREYYDVNVCNSDYVYFP